ncbi:hypothetical protein SNOG_10593 [Parastagonospora nodorum SN15]|uniref:Uncharacterized protein n=1 Tax=Phaeosphaeria nodorum (strain SN15 / ATCC MYA-4574 / FGSC 10173) TaxID=321614 RepID=Q0UCC1_PHANO|nr:hypothetical protein SNOG_10593 [Parastagonospora nodorum SN15]EAT81987.1 hypothetical protein SNOG_10593 [Parastagonospora nodorum SN15]
MANENVLQQIPLVFGVSDMRGPTELIDEKA